MKHETRKGTYVLLLDLNSETELDVGALGRLRFESGRYCYTGSAMGGLDSRLARHLRSEKKVRWHIDRLTIAADRREAWESYPDPIPECELARRAEACGMVPVHDGFGCSDCRCRTHLFRVPEGTDEALIRTCGLNPFSSN